jgi:hypothetical protein
VVLKVVLQYLSIAQKADLWKAYCWTRMGLKGERQKQLALPRAWWGTLEADVTSYFARDVSKVEMGLTNKIK